MPDNVKIQRMLKSFEAQLPEHEVGQWLFKIEPHPILVMDERENIAIGGIHSFGLLVGHGSCTRCGQQFDLGRWGNYSVCGEEEQERLKVDYPSLTTEAIVLKAQEDIQHAAERSGKCWGDVPILEEERSFATLDSVLTGNGEKSLATQHLV